MKKHIYIFLAIVLFNGSCSKPIGERPPTPSPYLPIICAYEGIEYDRGENIVLNSDGAELLFEVKDECASAYFREYFFEYNDNEFGRVLVQFHNYEGIDNYECDLFELKQIDEYRFNVRILPSKRDLIIKFIFQSHSYNYSTGRLNVIVKG